MVDRLPVESELRSLADKVERLISTNVRLHEENRTLRATNAEVAQERAALLAKNEQARARVEAMILRLRALEQNG